MQIPYEPRDVLFRIKRGLAGYVSYLAACEMNEAFSEYVLYEPVLRILTARKFIVQCEYECPGVQNAANGDKKRIDFVARRGPVRFAMEVKWARSATPNIKRDVEKMDAFKKRYTTNNAFLCVFGKLSDIEGIKLQHGDFRERGRMVCADFRLTKYGCRIYELAPFKQRTQSGV